MQMAKEMHNLQVLVILVVSQSKMRSEAENDQICPVKNKHGSNLKKTKAKTL